MTGGVALRPECVRSLCVMNSVCSDSWPVEMMLQLGHPAVRKKMSAAAVLRLLRTALRMGFHSKPERAFLDGLLSPWRTEVGKLSLIRNAPALNTNLMTEITRLLPKIKSPTLSHGARMINCSRRRWKSGWRATFPAPFSSAFPGFVTS